MSPEFPTFRSWRAPSELIEEVAHEQYAPNAENVGAH